MSLSCMHHSLIVSRSCLHLQVPTAERGSERLINVLFALLDGEREVVKLEDQARALLGGAAFVLFTLDTLVAQVRVVNSFGLAGVSPLSCHRASRVGKVGELVGMVLIKLYIHAATRHLCGLLCLILMQARYMLGESYVSPRCL